MMCERVLYLIEEQDARVLDERSGDRDALLLAARQLDAPFPQLRSGTCQDSAGWLTCILSQV